MVTRDIRREGHAWGEEAMSRYEMPPEKTEMIGGRLSPFPAGTVAT